MAVIRYANPDVSTSRGPFHIMRQAAEPEPPPPAQVTVRMPLQAAALLHQWLVRMRTPHGSIHPQLIEEFIQALDAACAPPARACVMTPAPDGP